MEPKVPDVIMKIHTVVHFVTLAERFQPNLRKVIAKQFRCSTFMSNLPLARSWCDTRNSSFPRGMICGHIRASIDGMLASISLTCFSYFSIAASTHFFSCVSIATSTHSLKSPTASCSSGMQCKHSFQIVWPHYGCSTCQTPSRLVWVCEIGGRLEINSENER